MHFVGLIVASCLLLIMASLKPSKGSGQGFILSFVLQDSHTHYSHTSGWWASHKNLHLVIFLEYINGCQNAGFFLSLEQSMITEALF